jgi:phenylacetic acid degradation operon negative regulatory protein
MADPRSTRSQNLIFTLYGDFLRDRVDEVWVGSLITLLEPLGMTDQAVRSTLSRMLRNGWFETRREGRHSFYSLTPRSERLLDEGKERLFAPRRPRPWDGRWRLLSYSIPESERSLRDRLRQRLVWLGFGHLNPGTWVTTYEPPADLRSWLGATGAERYVDQFTADYVGGDPRALVARAWELDDLKRAYYSFLREHASQHEEALRMEANGGLDPNQAFARRFELTQEYLDFPYVDPGLPEELLPGDWPGEDVRSLFHAYHDLLSEPAHAFVEECLAASPAAEDEEQIREAALA